MRLVYPGAALLCAMSVALAATAAPRNAREARTQTQDVESVFETPICVLPHREFKGDIGAMGRATVIAEAEPNDSLATAQVIPVGALPADIEVNGDNFNEEQDYYQVHLNKGDILGVAVRLTGANPNDIDTYLTIYDATDTLLLINDDSDAIGSYPVATELPPTGFRTDSFAAIVAPQTGNYTLLVEPFTGGGPPPQTSQGPYTMELRVRRNVFENFAGQKQILFLDFDGATVNAPSLFGFGNNPAVLSGLSTFLSDWGLNPGDESAIIDAVIAEVTSNLDALAFQNPDLDYEIRNSRDHADPFGGAHVSRVIIGGTIAELGINTIGIAETIDPGNFDTSETAVLLLDELSDTNPTNGISLNNQPRAGGFSLIDAIGVAVGNLTTHEFGHTIGGWHTISFNSSRNIMDQGASTLNDWRQNILETGPNGVMGDGDDNEVIFIKDSFADEGIAASPTSDEYTNFRAAYAMSSQAVTVGCPGDFNESGAVGGEDLALLLAQWGNNPEAESDLTGDGVVDGADLAQLLASWGPCP